MLFATGTVMSYLLNAFLPIAAYPASEAPDWRIGAKVYMGFACIAAAIYVGIYFGLQWEEKRKAKAGLDSPEGEAVAAVPSPKVG